ncbi:MAG: hypothetical protein JNM74_15480 [Myxococcales bacterium]|nr:hypothetical protein [Myxococcales bacterium]
MIPTGADSVMFFGTPVTHVSVSNASASFVTVGEGEDASMASFRAVP